MFCQQTSDHLVKDSCDCFGDHQKRLAAQETRHTIYSEVWNGCIVSSMSFKSGRPCQLCTSCTYVHDVIYALCLIVQSRAHVQYVRESLAPTLHRSDDQFNVAKHLELQVQSVKRQVYYMAAVVCAVRCVQT